MKKGIIIFALVLALVLIAGCATVLEEKNEKTEEQTEETPSTDAPPAYGRALIQERMRANPSSQCTELCTTAREKGVDLSRGPCLSDDESSFPGDWACDVAHNPRLPVDDEPKNQCDEYRESKVSHFVEVDENCKFIRRG